MRGLTLAMLCICGTVAGLGREPAQNVPAIFGGPENLKLVQYADRADACLLKAIYPPPPAKDDGRGQDIRPVRYEEGEFIDIPQMQVDALKSALSEEKTYRWGVVVGCYPIFHTRVRFYKGDHVVVLDFCFSCHLLVVTKDGIDCGGGLFSAEPPIFLNVMKSLFPEDLGLKSRTR